MGRHTPPPSGPVRHATCAHVVLTGQSCAAFRHADRAVSVGRWLGATAGAAVGPPRPDVLDGGGPSRPVGIPQGARQQAATSGVGVPTEVEGFEEDFMPAQEPVRVHALEGQRRELAPRLSKSIEIGHRQLSRVILFDRLTGDEVLPELGRVGGREERLRRRPPVAVEDGLTGG